MRHRASRSLFSRLRLSGLPLPDAGRRRVVAAAVLGLTAALTGVGVAVQSNGPEPSAVERPLSTEVGTPSSAAPPTVTHEPSHGVSRGGDRTPQPSPTPSPTPTSTPSAAETVLPELTSTPDVGSATATKAPEPSAPSSSAPSPADSSAPDTSASTTAVDSDSWTVAVSADEPASYECSLDGGSYRSCSGSTTFNDLDHGRHSLAARATDDAGNTDPSPAELTTTVTGSN